MAEETKCPKCDTTDIKFLGLHREGYGKDWQNSWECQKCKIEFVTEINVKQVRDNEGEV